ncbi:hypothetical protein I316_05267 [Kwoniella heveanensis BCC8398]|uniref:Beta-glucosidase n=1 Tax=Kwoniella heveanensis BCC8398 TaxID=1296120 RepID=A0A1B9GPC8_9TREE|nr:hypothetical protein I316_05267 [Kwoniella heveanensis BCC8398]
MPSGLSVLALLAGVVTPTIARNVVIPRQEAQSSSSSSDATIPFSALSSALASLGPAVTTFRSNSSSSSSTADPSATFTSTTASSTSEVSGRSSSTTRSDATASTTTAGKGPQSDCSTTTDLGWIPSGLPTPTLLPTTNANAINATRTGPLGNHNGGVDLGSDYSSQALDKFWDDWVSELGTSVTKYHRKKVGDVQQPPFREVYCPPQPYPLPEDPPALFPDYLMTSPPENVLTQYKFPDGFLFGWATAAQQWEGAVRDDGKGPTVWDWAARFPGFIVDNTTSDIARLAALGGNVYSFSAFWTRVLPWGSAESPVNQAGIDFYRNLAEYCWSQGVEPVLTLFHWDTPLALQLKYGGFASEDIIDDYVNYAETMFTAYNGTIKKWVTFNEPVVFCSQSTFPGNLTSLYYPYTCSYHLTLAHAKAVRRFRELNIQGEIAFKSDNFIGVPWREGNEDDQRGVDRHEAYQIGIFAEPIYNSGDWPQIIKDDLPPEILPRFTDEQKELIKGTADFFAIDGYRVGYVTAPPAGFEACIANTSDPLWPVCNQVNFYESTPYAWGLADFADPRVPWLQNTWRYIRGFLKDLTQRYPTNGGIYLSEFGFAEPEENEQAYKYIVTTDTKRELYFLSYLGEVLKAIHEDGTDVRGTFAWSLVDK